MMPKNHVIRSLYSDVLRLAGTPMAGRYNQISIRSITLTCLLRTWLGNHQVRFVFGITRQTIQMIFENRPMASQDVPNLFQMLTNQPKQLAEFACGELANGKLGCFKSVPNVDQSAQAVF